MVQRKKAQANEEGSPTKVMAKVIDQAEGIPFFLFKFLSVSTQLMGWLGLGLLAGLTWIKTGLSFGTACDASGQLWHFRTSQ